MMKRMNGRFARQPGARHARSGMSLIEIMIAMTILAIVLTSLARLSTSVSRQGRSNSTVAMRSAVLQQQAARLGGVPYSWLASVGTGTSTITVGGISYSRTITLTTATNRTTVKIVIYPTSDNTKKDSVIFDRANPPSGSPLCSGC